MKLVIGLGNIGEEYSRTRHNVGFLSLDHWARAHKQSFCKDKLFDFINKRDVCLIKPNTYMNRSGLALAEALSRWKCDEILVVHDDIELPLSKIRIRNGGGDGGHNGVKSLLEVQAPDMLRRLRIGIGRDEGNPRDYVLDEFDDGELQKINECLSTVNELIDIFIKLSYNVMLNQYSNWKKSCSEASKPRIICP
mgnify:FL=1